MIYSSIVFAQVLVFNMGNKLDIMKSLEKDDGFECHGLKYPPSYTDNSTRDRRNKSRMRKRVSTVGPDDWLHFDYPVDNVVLSGGGSKGYAFVGALKVRLQVCSVLRERNIRIKESYDISFCLEICNPFFCETK